MKWLKKYELFKEAKSNNNKSLITELCVAMVLINNEFLYTILDRGIKGRYNENTQIFLTDLKNLLLAKNRLKLGQYIDKKCVEDDETSKVNGIFDTITFDIEKEWNVLVNSRIIARNIIDKLLPNQKLTPEDIKNVYWLGPNKTTEYGEDIIIETTNGNQYSFFLNKNLSAKKTSSFVNFCDNIIPEDVEFLYGEEYLPKWNKLTQQWIKILYENANKNIQFHIEKFIDPNRIESIGYFDYFDIRHSDLKYKHLGEYMKDFDKNILKFTELMSEIWKNRESCFMDFERVYQEWEESKIVILNSRILENILTSSLKSTYPGDIEKTDDGFKKAEGNVKMKLFKTFIDKLGCLERPLYYLGQNGNIFNLLPEREFFRKYYDDLSIKFDYHVKFDVSEEEENNDFKIKMKLLLDNAELLNMDIVVRFSTEMSGKLNAIYQFELSNRFNYLISNKKNQNTENIE